MAHRSRRAGRAITLALASTLGIVAPLTQDRCGAGWQVAAAAGAGKAGGSGAGRAGQAAGAGGQRPREGGIAPRSGSAAAPRAAAGAGAAGAGAGKDDDPSHGGAAGGAAGPGAAGGGAPGPGAAGGGAPTGAVQGGNAPRGAVGAIGRRGIGDSNRGSDPPDRDAPDARPAGPAQGDAEPAARVRAGRAGRSGSSHGRRSHARSGAGRGGSVALRGSRADRELVAAMSWPAALALVAAVAGCAREAPHPAGVPAAGCGPTHARDQADRRVGPLARSRRQAARHDDSGPHLPDAPGLLPGVCGHGDGPGWRRRGNLAGGRLPRRGRHLARPRDRRVTGARPGRGSSDPPARPVACAT